MFARAIALIALGLATVAAASGPTMWPQPPGLAPNQGVKPQQWAAGCKDWDEWDKTAPPFEITGNTYYVGTCGIGAILIVGDKGDILIDAGPANAASLIAKNIEALGVRLSDVKILLNTHAHFDHAGGLAELKRLTGAKLLASRKAARALEHGGPSRDDPQFADHGTFPPVKVDAVVHDGQTIRLGNLALTAIATPGHTAGATSWRWLACTGDVCPSIVYADSLSPVSSNGYRFSDHEAYLAAYRHSIAKVSEVPCTILLTPHPSASDMVKRAATGQLFGGMDCKTYSANLSRALDERLAKEAHGG